MHIKDLFDLTGKTAIITGGGRGLGEQMAEGLAESGANIVLCSRKRSMSASGRSIDPPRCKSARLNLRHQSA
ncbi:SDR family NAD(P)-dependent oxidoreductase [Priestia megaterium]